MSILKKLLILPITTHYCNLCVISVKKKTFLLLNLFFDKKTFIFAT